MHKIIIKGSGVGGVSKSTQTQNIPTILKIMDQKIAVEVFLHHHEQLIAAMPANVDAFYIISGKE